MWRKSGVRLGLVAFALLGARASAQEVRTFIDPAKANNPPAFSSDADREYFRALWRGVTRGYDDLLATLSPDVDRRIDALAPIERALLVIGTWELAHRLEIPYRVVISEGIELAKRYGGTDGHKFVNAVLDRVAARLRADEIRALRGA